MVKGGLLQDDADWSKAGVKEGQRLMIRGTADEIVKAPKKGLVFAEDMPEEAQIVNLISCLAAFFLVRYTPSGAGNNLDQTSLLLTVATRDLFSELEKNVKPVAPMQFWLVLRKKYPQFGQLNNGAFMQQNNEECWTQLLYTLSQSLKSSSSRVHCAESSEESTEGESVYSLKCLISHEVNHLHEGLKQGLKSELEKASPALGCSAIYVKDSRINDLPRKSNQKAKILLRVDYPLELDVFYLCSDDLRKRLEAPRRILRDEESKKLGLKTGEKSYGSDNDFKMTDAKESSNCNGKSLKDSSQEGKSQKSFGHVW